jgi:predicted TIM-barrel fold metal-dependent hydrolase
LIVDCDSHFMPRDAFDYIDDEFESIRPRLEVDSKGILQDIHFSLPYVAGTTPLSPPGSGSRYPGNMDLDARMEYYEQQGINEHLMLPQFTGWWSYLIEPRLARSIAHSWNTAFLRIKREPPGRIHPVALVALQDVDGAIEELEWAVANGFEATVIDHTFPVWEHPYGTPTATHREVWPFFAKCEELDVPIFIHAVQHGHRIVNLMNFQIDGLDLFSPRDAQMNLVALITSGLLDRYPGLKFIQAESGAKAIKGLVQRMDGSFKRAQVDYEDDEGSSPATRRVLNSRGPQLAPPEVVAEKNQQLPSHYFKTNVWWTIETEEPELVEAAEFIGADRFLFATDYPHDDPGGTMKFKDVELLAANTRFSEADKERIRSENACEVFGLA